MAERIDWTTTPTMHVELPTIGCPHCLEASYIIVRSEDNGDDSTTRKCVCSKCSRPFKVAAERLPITGNLITWPE